MWPDDTMALLTFQVIACPLFGASHYLNQCWLIVNSAFKNEFQWIWINEDRKCCLQNVGHFVQASMWSQGDQNWPLSEDTQQEWLTDVIWHYWSWSTLTLKIACHQFRAKLLSEQTRQIRTPVLRIPPAVTSQAKMKNWLHECQKWVSHMISHRLTVWVN